MKWNYKNDQRISLKTIICTIPEPELETRDFWSNLTRTRPDVKKPYSSWPGHELNSWWPVNHRSWGGPTSSRQAHWWNMYWMLLRIVTSCICMIIQKQHIICTLFLLRFPLSFHTFVKVKFFYHFLCCFVLSCAVLEKDLRGSKVLERCNKYKLNK